MKIFIALTFLFSFSAHASFSDVNEVDERIKELISNLKNEKEMIQDGLSLGSRRSALESLFDLKIDQIRDLEKLNEGLVDYIKDLHDQIDRASAPTPAPAPDNQEYACTITISRVPFHGFSVNKEIAKKKALDRCMNEYAANHCAVSASRSMKCIR